MIAVRRRAVEPSETILDAAVYVFAERGYAAATLEEIARRAGFSHQTVRDRFGDKGRLWRAVQRAEWDQLLAAVARRVAHGADPRERLRVAVGTLGQIGTEFPSRMRVLMRCDPAAPAVDDLGDLRQWLVVLLEDAGSARAPVHAAMILAALCAVCGCRRGNAPATAAVLDEIVLLALGR